MKSTKYPFSTHRHSHDIEFRRNHVYNELYEAQATNADADRIKELGRLHEDLTALLLAILSTYDSRVSWLTGPQFDLAEERVIWARESRMKEA